MKPYLEKNPSQKRVGGVAQNEGPEFKPEHCQKKKIYIYIYTYTRKAHS
jgi:hypothetical protein